MLCESSESSPVSLEHLMTFLLDHLDDDLKESVKSLLDLDSIHEFGENIDQYGRKELPFPIKKIPESNRFSLIISYEYVKLNGCTSLVESNLNASDLSWYKKFHLRLDRHKKFVYDSVNSQNKKSEKEEFSEKEESQQSVPNQTQLVNYSAIQQSNELNQDCLDYIQKNSPLIASSLSFLFDTAKRNEFFRLLDSSSLNG
jgi:hypothetical protein